MGELPALERNPALGELPALERNPALGELPALERKPALGELQASAGARKEPVPLLHPWKGSSGTGAIEFHATQALRSARRAPTARCSFGSFKRTAPRAGTR